MLVKKRSRHGITGLKPDPIHSVVLPRNSTNSHLTTTWDLFPGATIVGDDWNCDSVRTVVETVARQRGVDVITS